jgi:HK97 family phage major capsid protein
MLKKLRATLAALQTRREEIKAKMDAGEDIPVEEQDEYLANVKEAKEVVAKIREIEEAEAAAADVDNYVATAGNTVPPAVKVVGPAAEQEKYPLGRYMQDIVDCARAHRLTPRVENYQKKVVHDFRAPTGSSEGVPSDGGFLVGKEMSDEIVKRVYNNTQLIGRVRKRTLTGNVNGIKLNGIDETSRADGSRYGGVRAYWVAEGDDITASKPKFRQMEFDLKKVAALYYATDEAVQDSGVLEQEATEAVSAEFDFKIQDAIINGDGAGKPLGFLSSPCVISVAKETGQAADTIVYENIVKMYSRFWGMNGIWIANRDTFPQLAQLYQAVGTGGVPVWQPANMAAGQPFQTLLGMPIVYVEQAATLGDKGDIVLADMSQYMLIDKGGMQAAMSIHVEFVADEIVYRWITRVDGQPLWNSALTPYKGSATRSPFVAIANRA